MEGIIKKEGYVELQSAAELGPGCFPTWLKIFGAPGEELPSEDEGYSQKPDLNPTENVCGELKTKVFAGKP